MHDTVSNKVLPSVPGAPPFPAHQEHPVGQCHMSEDLSSSMILTIIMLTVQD